MNTEEERREMTCPPMLYVTVTWILVQSACGPLSHFRCFVITHHTTYESYTVGQVEMSQNVIHVLHYVITYCDIYSGQSLIQMPNDTMWIIENFLCLFVKRLTLNFILFSILALKFKVSQNLVNPSIHKTGPFGYDHNWRVNDTFFLFRCSLVKFKRC